MSLGYLLRTSTNVGKRSIIRLAEDENEQDFDRYNDPKEDDDFDKPYSSRRCRTTLPKHIPNPFRRQNHGAGLRNATKKKKT